MLSGPPIPSRLGVLQKFRNLTGHGWRSRSLDLCNRWRSVHFATMAQPVAYLTRREQISCCHRLNSEHLSEQANIDVYGKCNNFWGHGHNYTVEVTVRGRVNPATGMVMNITDLKKYMGTVLMDELDHKNLDKDVPYFKNVVSTTENVAIYIFNKLKGIMPNPELLYEVKIHETDKNIVLYRGETES